MSQHTVGSYKRQSLFGGWTRVELLLQLYERAIESVVNTKAAEEINDPAAYSRFFVDAQKTILAIHSGLKPDEYDVAFNIARLLHFVLTCLEKKSFDDAIKILTEMKSGFESIRDEANQMEAEGKIPPLESSDVYRTTA